MIMFRLKFNRSIFILVVILEMSSCRTTQKIPDQVELISITKLACDSSTPRPHFFTYYAGEKFDFKYQTIAVINAVNGNKPKKHPLDYIKIRAAKECADGIIQVSQSLSKGQYKEIEHIEHWDKSIPVETNHSFPQNAYTAIAIKLNDSSDLQKIRLDQNFLEQTSQNQKEKIKSANAEPPCEECNAKRGSKGLIIAGACIAIVFGILSILSR